MGNPLPFELTEEAFTGSVVAAMPGGTHAEDTTCCDSEGAGQTQTCLQNPRRFLELVSALNHAFVA